MNKDYNSYMDNLSVDVVLHERIMKRLKHQPTTRGVMKRYTAILASAALLAACIWGIPLLLPQVSPLPPNPPAFSLILNPTESITSTKKYIPGYFTQELTQAEIKAILGEAVGNNGIGIAGFSGEGNLEEVTISYNTSTNTNAVIILAMGQVMLDYDFPDEPEVTYVNGISIIAGQWTLNGETNYYASFVHGSIGYHLELMGDEVTAAELTALVSRIITKEPADLSQIQPIAIP